MQKSPTAAQLLVRYLEAEGVKYAFGIPGGPLMPIYEALHDSGRIQTVLAKHEEGAAFMADGYARVRRGLGVCLATSGPGCTNTVTGIATSFADGVPVLLITAQVSTEAFGKGAIQESTAQGVNVIDILRPMTKASLMLHRADKMGETIRHLLRTAMSGRPGPVHLNIPADLATKFSAPEDVHASKHRHSNFYFDRDSIKQAAQYLLRARSPAILAGNGINLSGAYDELKRLAEKLLIPVATTVKAKGAFPEDHLLSLGVFGFAGSPRADAYLLSGQPDVLLAVGTSLGEDATNGWDPRLKPKEALLQIDIDPHQIGNNYPVKVSLLGDAKTVLAELLHELNRQMQWVESPRSMEKIHEFRRQYPWCVGEEKMYSEEIPLKPQRLMNDLSAVLPRDAIVFCDMGNHMAWAFHYLRMTRPHSMFHCLGFASMGHGVTACIGAKLAAPDRPVVAIVGDAGFAMNGMEVHTAVENNIPVVWLVLNNGGHGMVYHGENALFGGRFHTGLYRHPLDLCKMAEAMGASGRRVTRPGELRETLETALLDGRPTVIDAVIDREEVPPVGSRMKALDKFFESALIKAN